ncbi:g8526 [Coccomyxa viridis]|uniref:G8526 protein n=1 Tax=Coccomyxa viridis TaxID=1274662 RepID=A0ABP1G0J8_9CHLO
MSSSDAKLTLYTAGTPNGWKPSITLEELGIPYEVKSISLPENEQKQDWFLKINPNGRIPAMVDHSAGNLPIFESGAIMWYLGMRHDPQGKIFPKDIKKQTEVMSWLMFQMGGLGPMQGQANHFVRYAPEQIEYAKNRYVNETNRLYQVLDTHLKTHEWLAADQYTIADIANFSWVFAYFWAGATVDDKPHLKAWYEKILARPEVQKGLDVPEANAFKKALGEEEIQKMVGEARKVMVSTEKK